MKRSSLFIILPLALFTACQQKPLQEDKDPSADMRLINEVNTKYENYYNAGDAAGVASLHTEDAMIMPPNFDFVIGKEAIEAAIKSEIEMGAQGLKFDQIELIVNGNYAYETGKFALKVVVNSEVLAEDHGKYVVVWEKQKDGNWLMEKDIWNTSIPLASE